MYNLSDYQLQVSITFPCYDMLLKWHSPSCLFEVTRRLESSWQPTWHWSGYRSTNDPWCLRQAGWGHEWILLCLYFGSFIFLPCEISKTTRLYKYIKIVYEGCSKFFHLENVIFAKKKFLSPNFRELHVFLSRYMLAKILKKNVDVWYPQIVPGVWSLVTLHSAAAALKHLRSALRCWSLLTFIGQFRHNNTTV